MQWYSYFTHFRNHLYVCVCVHIRIQDFPQLVPQSTEITLIGKFLKSRPKDFQSQHQKNTKTINAHYIQVPKTKNHLIARGECMKLFFHCPAIESWFHLQLENSITWAFSIICPYSSTYSKWLEILWPQQCWK